ncbi:putative Tyrosine specific protein phosphatases domain-containing protein [Seiridium cardinale]|uniref:Tyrosine specific protein phosphatases domain-containing protein n=1 Tax=Seiridium cardinale TaxID=138064 RepID=A0ABR2XJL0_9PEZI
MSDKFDNILNFRDVGKTVNEYLGKRVLQEGVLYRSARPDDASFSDRKKLKETYGIRTVIDLRTKTEHLKQAQKRQADLKVPALLQSNAALAEPVQIPGLNYLEIKVTGKKFENHLTKQLSWRRYLKLIALYLSGYRIEAIRIIANDVMLPRGLVGMAIDTLDQSGAEIAEALRTFLQPSSPAVLVHCTQGKDRTGLTVAMCLLILHVPLDAITHDYLLTQTALTNDAPPQETEARLAEIAEMGLSPEWGDCPPNFVNKVAQHLEKTYGGVEKYLDGIGFGAAERVKFVQVLGARDGQ